MSWLILAFLIPIVVAWKDGSTYGFSFSVALVGAVLYFLNIFLIRFFVGRRAPSTLDDGTWEDTASKGVVPKWVSILGLIGIGFVPSGLIVALLLFLKIIINRG